MFFFFCEQNDIVHEFTTSYTPKQNVVVERKKNWTLIDMVSSGVPKNLLGEA